MHLVRRNYVEDVDETALIRGAVRGMLAELDPHSALGSLACNGHERLQGGLSTDRSGRVPKRGGAC
jgi:hypothetical protein